MAYDAPTPADLKAKFSAFASVPDATVQLALNEAARRVDTSWTEGDFATAQMLYAAHVMTMDGQGDGSEAANFLDGTGPLKSRKAGGSQEVFVTGSGASVALAGSLGSTSYGRRFIEQQRLNCGGPITTGGGAGGYPGTCSPYLDGGLCRLPGW